MIEVEHVSKAFRYTNPDPNSNSGDMWVDYVLGLFGREGSPFAAKRLHKVAVDDISFDVHAGEFFGLLGPNGAGKSTLVRLISTVLSPTSGSIRVAGYDTIRQPAFARAALSVVPANGWLSFDSHLSVGQNLDFWGRLFGLDAKVTARRMDEALHAVGLDDARTQLPTSLSSGMRQRLAIAKGLLVRSPVFILDEPTANVDPVASGDIQDFIRTRLSRDLGQTILMTTHNMLEAERLCDRIGIIDRGRLVACDTPASLLHHLRNRVIEVDVDSQVAMIAADFRLSPLVRRVQEVATDHDGGSLRLLLHEDAKMSDVQSLLIGLGCGCKQAAAQGEIRRASPSLEDVFFDLTVRDKEK